MFLFPCIYDPAQHELIKGSEIIDWCKRQTKAPAEKERWFLYRHKKHGTFVIARWAQDQFGIFTDFLNLGHSLANFNREKAHELRHRLYAPIAPEEMSKAVSNAMYENAQEVAEKNDKMRDIRRRHSGRRDIWN